MSSTHSARCGTRSLIHLPHWPYCFQSHGLFMHGAGTALEQLDLLAGIERLAVPLDQLRLVVERVALAGGARHEELHDALGLGRWCRPPLRSGFRAGRGFGQQVVWPSRWASAMPPRPPPRRQRNSRRSPFREWEDCSIVIATIPQSMNMNSLLLKITRQAFARPCFARSRRASRFPPASARRPSANRYAASICSCRVGRRRSSALGEMFGLPHA